MNTELRDRVLAIYRAADDAVAEHAPVCESSGRCCRFAEYGHTLFLSELEADVLVDAATAFDGPITPAGCPFQVGNLCTAREPRPLGCRVYFCDPKFQAAMPVITERFIVELKQLHEEFGRPWRYAPLHEFLGQADVDGKGRRPLTVI